VCFPLWPVTLRIGVWYLSMAMLGLIGLFFVMAIFRLILFCVTVFTVPPGLWLYPNLFEDVGFFDSFRPGWGWQEVCISEGTKLSPPRPPRLICPIAGSQSCQESTTRCQKSQSSSTGCQTPRHHCERGSRSSCLVRARRRFYNFCCYRGRGTGGAAELGGPGGGGRGQRLRWREQGL
jgi:Translocation protein Sec62